MTTPLQQAAQAVIDHCYEYNPHELPALHLELRKALDSELAQSVEPFAWKEFTPDGSKWFLAYGKNLRAKQEPLYLHPPQPYDQQAMELCSECGWKAIMPGEPCFVCNMNLDAQ